MKFASVNSQCQCVWGELFSMGINLLITTPKISQSWGIHILWAPYIYEHVLNLQIYNMLSSIFSSKCEISGVTNYKLLDLQIFNLQKSLDLANLPSSGKYAGSPNLTTVREELLGLRLGSRISISITEQESQVFRHSPGTHLYIFMVASPIVTHFFSLNRNNCCG